MVDEMDGYRFQFIMNSNNLCIMKDVLEEFEDVALHDAKLGEVLAMMLAEQHNLRIEKNNQFAKLHALIKIAEETELDKEVLIACINNSGVFKEK